MYRCLSYRVIDRNVVRVLVSNVNLLRYTRLASSPSLTSLRFHTGCQLATAERAAGRADRGRDSVVRPSEEDGVGVDSVCEVARNKSELNEIWFGIPYSFETVRWLASDVRPVGVAIVI